jgi:hypothetical protein
VRLATTRRALGIALWMWSGPLLAAHPYVTDDTGTQGAGRWQLELLAERGRNARTADPGAVALRQVRTVTAFNPVLTYGVTDALDVAFGLHRLRQRTAEDGAPVQSAAGAGDSTLELKWRFFEREGLSLALKPGISLPTGDENRGLGTGRASWVANLILTSEAKPWTFLANVAYSRARYKLATDSEANRERLWRVSAGAAYALRENLRLVGEAGARSNGAKDDPFLPGRAGRFAMLGLIWSLAEGADLDLGVRKRLNDAEFDTAILVGATLRW